MTQPKGRRRRAKVRGLGKGEGESADAGPNLRKPKKRRNQAGADRRLEQTKMVHTNTATQKRATETHANQVV